MKKLIGIAALLLLSSCGNSLEQTAKEKLGTLTEMAELGTVEYTITKIIKASDKAFYTIGDRKILFSCSATMKAGVDLDGFSTENVSIIPRTKRLLFFCRSPKFLHSICQQNRQN